MSVEIGAEGQGISDTIAGDRPRVGAGVRSIAEELIEHHSCRKQVRGHIPSVRSGGNVEVKQLGVSARQS